MSEKKLISVLVPIELYDKITASAVVAQYGRSSYLRQLFKKYYRYMENHPECAEELGVQCWKSYPINSD